MFPLPLCILAALLLIGLTPKRSFPNLRYTIHPKLPAPHSRLPRLPHRTVHDEDDGSRLRFTFEFCSSDAQCAAPRNCLSAESSDFTCAQQAEQGAESRHDGLHCHCFPPQLRTCSAIAKCQAGEVCAYTFYTEQPVCVSKHAEEDIRWIEAIPVGPTQSPQAPGPGGLAFDICKFECRGERVCLFSGLGTSYDECAGRAPCYCFYMTRRFCLTDSDCDAGEACAETFLSNVPICVSKNAAIRGNRPVSLDNTKGYNLDPCHEEADCQPGRSCLAFNDLPTVADCYGLRPCICIPRKVEKCERSAECDSMEVCATSFLTQDPFCVSKRVVESLLSSQEISPNGSVETEPSHETPASSGGAQTVPPSPSQSSFTAPSSDDDMGFVETSLGPSQTPVESSICVDAEALEHLPRDELVFRSHSRALVLCDKQGSCATPGHMVVFGGRAMMMKAYCTVAGCIPKVILVNSPRYRRGRRIRSKTKGLFYSAFAARYATVAEAIVLSLAVRYGL